MATYPAKIVRDGKGFLVTFPDFPGVFSSGVSIEDAKVHAVEALETALYFRVKNGEDIPFGSGLKVQSDSRRRHHSLISVSASFEAKLLLLAVMKVKEVRPVELARRLGMQPQELTRLLDLRHTSKVDAIATALNALGKRLELSLAS